MTLQYLGRKSGEIFEPQPRTRQSYSLSNNAIIQTLEYTSNASQTGEKSYLRYTYTGSFEFNSNELTTASISDVSLSLWSPFGGEAAWSLHFDTPLKLKPHELTDAKGASRVNYSYREKGNQRPTGLPLLENQPVTNNRSTISAYSWAPVIDYGWWNDPFNLNLTGSSGSISTSSTSSSATSLTLNKNYDTSAIITAILGSSTPSNALSVDVSDKTLTINASSWTGSIKINFAAKAAAQGERLDAKQIDFTSATPAGSILQGGDGNDQLWGKAGWDVFDGGKGNDLIRAGNGRDILTGGSGADELHGDFGWNTYKSEKDGFSDLIAIKSDQHLSNWIYGKAGNNPNGEKADIIEGLDANDKIRIIGVFSPDITVRAGATAHGVSGIGIYAKGALEALYTGGDLSVAQLTAMTSGDGSAAAMANQVSSYGWTGV